MTLAITGLRGVGKSQLAAAYARTKLAEGWRLVAWVNAVDTGSLLAGLAAVADAAGLSDGVSASETVGVGQAVRRWLEADGERCLLVLDEVEDPDAVWPFVPAIGGARVLITTTRQSITSVQASVPVDVFSADEALEFLDERTGLEDDAGAAAVATELGSLPMALAMAASVMVTEELGYGAYLERLRTQADVEYAVQSEERLYPRGAAEAVLLSLEAIGADDRVGVCTRVMEVMAVLSAAGVRREMLHAAGQAGVLADDWRRMRADQVDRALEELARRSLLMFSLDGHTVIAHRLVLQLVREKLARRGRLTAVCRSAASVLEARAGALTETLDRPALREITQQVMALLGIIGGADKEMATLALQLRFWALYYLIELGDMPRRPSRSASR